MHFSKSNVQLQNFINAMAFLILMQVYIHVEVDEIELRQGRHMVFMPHGLGISSANQRAAHNQRSKSSGYIRPSHCHANHEWVRSQGPPCHQWQDPKSLSHKYHVTHRQTDRDTDNRTRNKMADQTKLKTQDWTWTNRKQRSWNNRNIYILVSLT